MKSEDLMKVYNTFDHIRLWMNLGILLNQSSTSILRYVRFILVVNELAHKIHLRREICIWLAGEELIHCRGMTKERQLCHSARTFSTEIYVFRILVLQMKMTNCSQVTFEATKYVVFSSLLLMGEETSNFDSPSELLISQ